MNQPHHEQLAHDLLDNFRKYRREVSPKTERALALLQANRELFVRSTSAPDRLCDTSLKMVWFLPNKTSVAGHNLTSFQHFATLVPDPSPSGAGWSRAGYCWDRDDSLGWLDKVVDYPVKLLHSHVQARTDDPWYSPEVLQNSPIVQAAKRDLSKFNEFAFPSAIDVAQYFYWASRAVQSDEEWIKCVGHVLHLLVDMCVPHHVKGWLLNGHQDWENEIEANWTKWRFSFSTCSRLPWIDDRLARCSPMDKIAALLATAASSTSTWMNNPQNHSQAVSGEIAPAASVDVCRMALDFCVKALEIVAEQRP